VLIDWINDELADFRIIVKDLEEDLFDGQILQKLIGMSLLQYWTEIVHFIMLFVLNNMPINKAAISS